MTADALSSPSEYDLGDASEAAYKLPYVLAIVWSVPRMPPSLGCATSCEVRRASLALGQTAGAVDGGAAQLAPRVRRGSRGLRIEKALSRALESHLGRGRRGLVRFAVRSGERFNSDSASGGVPMADMAALAIRRPGSSSRCVH